MIGFDLDGTITERPGSLAARISIPHWVVCLGLKILRPKIDPIMALLVMEYKKRGKKIVIITARPEMSKAITKDHLTGIPIDETHFVGNGPNAWRRKVEKVKKLELERFYDNDEKVVQALKKEGFEAVLVKRRIAACSDPSPPT